MQISSEQQSALRLYQSTVNDERVDQDLVAALVKHITSALGNIDGAILVFLPGYEDIVALKERLSSNTDLLVLALHSQMVSSDQKMIFRPAPSGMRKVVLSTNIAETSLTVEDVVFVIDSGKVKEVRYDRYVLKNLIIRVISTTLKLQKSYDSLTEVSMLRTG